MALVVQRWQHNGQHRLYVKDTDTRAQLGYYDVRTGKLTVQDDARSYEIVSVLRPFLSGSVPEGLQHLMPERPATSVEPAGTQGFETFSASAPRPRTRGARRLTSWRSSKAERVVGRRLARLGRDGWDVLRAMRVGGGDEVEHLVVGPPGVFTISTLHHRRARIRVGSQVVWVDDSIREYLRNARGEAASVARRLSRTLGDLNVPVIPVLAFVEAAAIETHHGHSDVLVVAAEELDARLRECRGELSLPERDRIVAAAHRVGLWTI